MAEYVACLFAFRPRQLTSHVQAAVKRYAEDVRRAEGVAVQIRVGVNSGEVVVRSIGGDLRMDYTAVGQTTHMAARMEQLATPGSILMTAEALRLAEGYVEVKPLGPVNVKGLGGPVDVFEMTGAGPVRTRLQASATRGLTRFVGRDVEVEQLRQAQEQAAGGRGQVVAVVGEPGVGKSRLFYKFEVAYGSLLGERRRDLHARIVQATEQLVSARPEEDVERLAHHAYRGEVWDKAVGYLDRAGRKAASRSAHREAVVTFEHALVALRHAPDNRQTLERGIDLRRQLDFELFLLGEMTRSREVLEEAERCARALGDRRRLGEVLDRLGDRLNNLGLRERAIDCFRQALDIAAELDDLGLDVSSPFIPVS